MRKMTQITFAKPDMSWRRNRSPNTVMSNQNHSTNMKIANASTRKFLNVKPSFMKNTVVSFSFLVRCVADDRTGHAVAAAAATAKFRTGDSDHLDACLAQQCIRIGVAVIGEDNSRRGADEI